MFRTTYFKKFLVPGSLSASVFVEGEGETTSDTQGNLVRRTDLPIYKECLPPSEKKEEEEEPSGIEKGISAIRKELWVWNDYYKGYREKVVDVVVTGKEHTAVFVDQLRKDELPVPRSGAIAISGLAGVVLGLRGGWIKRIFYGSTCAGIMAAVCYPKEVSEVSQEGLGITKKYVMVAYNFIYGVKPESLKLPSPSQLLGGSVEVPEKSTADVVSEKKPKPVVRIVTPAFEDQPGTPRNQPEESTPQDPSCTCNVAPCREIAPTEQGLPSSPFLSDFDHFSEQSADVMYWGFRLN